MVVHQICPQAPAGAQAYADEIAGYVVWGVLALFVIGVVVGIGAVVAGRVFAMPQASRAGIVSVVAVMLAAVGYMILPGMVQSITGSGCV